jgi:hypothetical protein
MNWQIGSGCVDQLYMSSIENGGSAKVVPGFVSIPKLCRSLHNNYFKIVKYQLNFLWVYYL